MQPLPTTSTAGSEGAENIYNPYANLEISCSFLCHKNRGSQGGIDYYAGKGTEVRACGEGLVTRASSWGDGGYTVTVDHGGGISSYYLHLSRYTVSTTTLVKQGDLLGYSGGVKGEPGSGSSTGAHIHWHINNNGTVVDPAIYVSAHPDEQSPELEEFEDMFVVRATQSGIVPAGMKLMITINASHSVSDTTLTARGIDPGTIYGANDATLRLILRDHGIPESRAMAQDKADETHASILSRLKPIADKVGAIWA